jgi:hypothetical protein
MSTMIEARATTVVERQGPTAPGRESPRGWRAAGVAVVAAGGLVAAALLPRPPAAPVVPQTSEVAVAGLPAMPTSMGFWDFVQPPAPARAPPAMPNDLGFWDRLR